MIFQFNHKFFIAKAKKAYIIHRVLGASSNGRTRDFGSLYHGSNPCAPTNIQTPLVGVLILAVRMFDLKHRSTTSRFYKRCAVKSLRLPRSHALACARESVRSNQKFNRHLPVLFLVAHGCARMSTVQHVPFENAVFVGVAHTTCMAYTKISN